MTASNQSPHDFSFDVYPGLESELQAAYERNQTDQAMQSAVIATDGLALAVAQATHREILPDTTNLGRWMHEELTAAFSTWQKYEGVCDGLMLPNRIGEFLEDNPKAYETLERLYDAKQALGRGELLTPDGEIVGDTMQIILMPWGTMLAHTKSRNLAAWIGQVRDVQSGLMGQKISNDEITDPWLEDAMYKGASRSVPDVPARIYRNPDRLDLHMTIEEYLEAKVKSDGDIGFMLIQTNDHPGTPEINGQAPGSLTRNGYEHCEVEGYAIDNLGVLEDFCLTAQEGVESHTNRWEWQLANRNYNNQIPISMWHDRYGSMQRMLMGAMGPYSGKAIRFAVA